MKMPRAGGREALRKARAGRKFGEVTGEIKKAREATFEKDGR